MMVMKTERLFQRMVLAGVLAAGSLVAWSIFGLWTAGIVQHWNDQEHAHEHLYFLADGTPRITRYSDRLERAQFRDVEGNIVGPPSEETGGGLSPRPLLAGRS